ncbi:hypothetical protein SODALDRAFT_325135 [Sodiomyces alkalinus F11]|uniref:Roadblock/LAMTOR2 domain-containing protein n=1 Tax=Sodiomyces alkalinus (strain CBS 110278 / VKM F-3762 / F11) TaxID=1314773 RepID=A0A3N2PTB7_SODAK|nr:hypothetical protein SODALDRAFT_325135 [Sodiomyces alkalinus F11]ROT37556.1 hypothetical protein SODALDRAFT_325135 [Sodiomyces alkalinus F11]
MVDPISISGHDALDEKLTRLSKKPGVKATVVLDRATGAILRTNGQLSNLISTAAAALKSPTDGGSFSSEAGATQNGESHGFEEFTRKVWTWVNASGGLVEEFDTEDELKLLRLRTKKQELVIVPDAKYLLILVHDTPPA